MQFSKKSELKESINSKIYAITVPLKLDINISI